MVFPHKFWRPFWIACLSYFFRPQYVWFPVHLKGHLIPLWYETPVVNWQNWLFTLFHQSRSVLSPNPIASELGPGLYLTPLLHGIHNILFQWYQFLTQMLLSKWQIVMKRLLKKHGRFKYKKGPIISQCMMFIEFIINTLPAKTSNIWKPQWKHSYLTFWFAENVFSPTTNKCCGFDTTLPSSVVEKMQCPKCADTLQNVDGCVIFNTSPKIYPIFKDTHHYIVDLW